MYLTQSCTDIKTIINAEEKVTIAKKENKRQQRYISLFAQIKQQPEYMKKSTTEKGGAAPSGLAAPTPSVVLFVFGQVSYSF